MREDFVEAAIGGCSAGLQARGFCDGAGPAVKSLRPKGLSYTGLSYIRGDIRPRRDRIGALRARAMRGERRLRPIVQHAARGAGDKLLCAFADQAHDLRAGSVVEVRGAHSGLAGTLPRNDLRHLFGELAVVLQCSLDIFAHGVGQTAL